MGAQVLTANAVREIVLECLFNPEELPGPDTLPGDAVTAKGIMRHFAFHPGRLSDKKPAIARLLAQLEDQFFEHRGGGMSFLRACCDRNGEQWGEHSNMEELFALGLATGLVKELMPRELWPSLPGGVPYYSVSAEVLGPKTTEAA